MWPTTLTFTMHYELCLIGMKCALSLNVLWWTFHMCICFMTCKGKLVSPIILNSVDLSCATVAAEHDCRTAHYQANAAAHLTWTTGKLDCKTDGLIGLNCWYLINRSKLLPVPPIISLIWRVLCRKYNQRWRAGTCDSSQYWHWHNTIILDIVIWCIFLFKMLGLLRFFFFF